MSSGTVLANEVSESAEVVASRGIAGEKLGSDCVEPETETACNRFPNDENPGRKTRNTRNGNSLPAGERENSCQSPLDTASTVCRSQNSPCEEKLEQPCAMPSSELRKTASEQRPCANANTLNDVDKTKAEITMEFLTSVTPSAAGASEISNCNAGGNTEDNAAVEPLSSQVDDVDCQLVALQASVNAAKTGRSAGEVSVIPDGANASLMDPVFSESPTTASPINEELHESGPTEIAGTNEKDGNSASDVTPSGTPNVCSAISSNVITTVLPVAEDRTGSNPELIRCADSSTSKATSGNATSAAGVSVKAETLPCRVSGSPTSEPRKDAVRTPDLEQRDSEYGECPAEQRKRSREPVDERERLVTTDVPGHKDEYREMQSRFYVDSTTVSSSDENRDSATEGKASREDSRAEELTNVVPKSPKRIVVEQRTPDTNTTSKISKQAVKADDSNGSSRVLERAPCSTTRSLLTAMKAVQEEADDSQGFEENNAVEPVEAAGSSSSGVSSAILPCENTKLLLDTVKTALQENVEKLTKFAQATEQKAKPPAPKSAPEDYGNLEGLAVVDDCVCDFICDVPAVCTH